ncbi:MAG: hypothetical protein ACJ8H8_07110 [Geminicoccaceae bacterium]
MIGALGEDGMVADQHRSRNGETAFGQAGGAGTTAMPKRRDRQARLLLIVSTPRDPSELRAMLLSVSFWLVAFVICLI